MNLQNRINNLVQLGHILQQNSPELETIKQRAYYENNWFIPEFINHALQNITQFFLTEQHLQKFTQHYNVTQINNPKKIGIVMAGNIPVVGFHDFLCVYLSGHQQQIKLSSKDTALWQFIFTTLQNINAENDTLIQTSELLKGCDAYIATGSNNSGRYFEQYFGKYPNIIRKNRTSVAVLTGAETETELQQLADDIHLYFGLGCRNVTKIYVPENYDFVQLLNAFAKYKFFIDHNKYKNNYDYQLALALMNNIYYMTNEATLLIENEQLFSAISQLNYSFYNNPTDLEHLQNNPAVQCIIGNNYTPFGTAQKPDIFTFADGLDTMSFLVNL
jgi:hypothetical protein